MVAITDTLMLSTDKAAMPRLAVLLACLVVGYMMWSVIYNLFFSPLRKVPGPILWAISPIPQGLSQCFGSPHIKIRELHQKYGDVVRTGPKSVSLLNHDAWRQVIGHRKAGQPENLKEASVFQAVPNSIIAADSENHSRIRRVLANGFSAQSMIKQESLISVYIDLFFDRLREHHLKGKPVDVVKWFNYVTFDVIGDLAFGEPFGCLENSDYHSWVAMIFQQFKEVQVLAQLQIAYPTLSAAISPILQKFAAKKIRTHNELVELKVAKRLALQSERPDFMDAMIAPGPDGKQKLSLRELQDNASVLIVAGSETTATSLCGITSLLCAYPEVQTKLREEVLSEFSSESEITLLSVQKLKYMTAVIDEGLRVYPAAPASMPRLIHQGGATICDTYLPQGTLVDIWHWSMYHSENNFTLPESFIPERWLGDPRFENDHKDAFQPFSVGGRNCLGRNLAYAEMRLILARLVWNYDLSLVNEADRDWVKGQKMWVLWDKPALQIHLERRKDQ
ncbi:cytochrome P450 monooxygenase [Daldinia decipiens]|uniref:cytochrome P450 monooxygenase n=1 Tax=Daldinia decipiens TaxID=326647 RepID=UPI0020C2758D|nr:cytochrome P450 monooxygenase [Daldinia decipiens]KAI1653684.1 cytochrome P450 monooxygenase [Daldinia decipiens]